jgi:hypothetical protein
MNTRDPLRVFSLIGSQPASRQTGCLLLDASHERPLDAGGLKRTLGRKKGYAHGRKGKSPGVIVGTIHRVQDHPPPGLSLSGGYFARFFREDANGSQFLCQKLARKFIGSQVEPERQIALGVDMASLNLFSIGEGVPQEGMKAGQDAPDVLFTKRVDRHHLDGRLRFH